MMGQIGATFLWKRFCRMKQLPANDSHPLQAIPQRKLWGIWSSVLPISSKTDKRARKGISGFRVFGFRFASMLFYWWLVEYCKLYTDVFLTLNKARSYCTSLQYCMALIQVHDSLCSFSWGWILTNNFCKGSNVEFILTFSAKGMKGNRITVDTFASPAHKMKIF